MLFYQTIYHYSNRFVLLDYFVLYYMCNMSHVQRFCLKMWWKYEFSYNVARYLLLDITS